MIKKTLLILSILFISNSCALDVLDRPSLSTFKVVSQNEFMMSAFGRANNEGWAGSSVNAHRRWIKDYLEKNNMCPSSYDIYSVIKTPTGRARSHYMYKGRCARY